VAIFVIMSALSLKNFVKTLSSTFIKNGEILFKKNAVRELEPEADPLSFVAFVDDGNDSFDVHISTNKLQHIIAHSCDCNDEYFFCCHKIAVLYKLKETTIAPTGKKKKESASSTLLNNLSHDALIGFMQKKFANDKTFELEFVNEFLNIDKVWSKKEIIDLLNNSIKTVVGKRKRIVKPELQKIAELTKASLLIYVKQVNEAFKEEGFLEVIETIQEYFISFFSFIINTNLSTVFTKAIISELCNKLLLFEEKSLPINFLKAYFKIIEDRQIHATVSEGILEILILNSNSDQKRFLIDFVHHSFNQDHTFFSCEFLAKHMINIIDDLVYLKKYKRRRYENSYNKQLIDQLINLKDYTTAEQYCIASLNENYVEAYNYLYWDLLKQVYLSTNNHDGLMSLLLMKAPRFNDFNEYALLMEHLEDVERKTTLRKQVVNYYAGKVRYDKIAETFYFQLLVSENKFDKVYHFFNDASLSNILLVFDNLYSANRALLLVHIINKTDYGLSYDKDVRADYLLNLPVLLEKIKANYTLSDIQHALQKSNRYTNSEIKKHLIEAFNF
jgi:hypothetical protein